MDNIPYGYCQCGCGQKTAIARRNNRVKAHVKGEPYKFLRGHHAAKQAPSNRSVNQNNGLCHCGCGESAPIATASSRQRGTIQGKPLKYRSGHNNSYLPPSDHGVNQNNGLCYCGCGEKAPLITHTNRKRGVIKGQPGKYIPYHRVRKSAVLYIEEDRGHDTSCWIWQRGDNGEGYGVLYRDGRRQYAHRYFYEQKHGSIPKDLVIDHLCNTPSCCNPDHLEPVTRRENFLRGS